jgi:hypothetical protein
MHDAIQSLDPRTLFEHVPDAYLRRSGGRETFLWNGGPGLDCVVKRFNRDSRLSERLSERISERISEGLSERLSERLRERFIGGVFSPRRSPAQREHDNLIQLTADGFLVPRAITWCDERPHPHDRVTRSLVVMERIPHQQTLRDRLVRAPARERRVLLAKLAALVARFHARGWHHRDLYVHHVALRDDDDEFVLLDLGRARRVRSRPRRRWLVKDLAAVLHSCPPSVTRRERLELLARWLDRLEIEGRARRRRWIAAVDRKRARIAAHVPRDERPLAPAHAP